jgi:hypothetical protein
MTGVSKKSAFTLIYEVLCLETQRNKDWYLGDVKNTSWPLPWFQQGHQGKYK